MKTIRQTAAAAAVTLCATGAAAQAPSVSTEIGLYAFGVSIGGETEVGDATLENDLSVSDILDALEGVFLAYVEHQRDDLILFWRSEFMDLKFDSSATRGPVSVDTDARFAQWTHHGYVGYRFHTSQRDDGATVTADVLGGARYVSIDMEIDGDVAALGGNVSRRFDRTIEFTDPVVALRAKYAFANGWGLAGWIDVGGFGVGSEYSTSAEVTIDRTWANGWRVFGGWKYFTFRYEDDSRFGDLVVKPTYSGPVLGASYRF